MSTKQAVSSAELQRGRNAAEHELTEAREAHAKAAYTHAMDRNDEVARQALIKAQQRLDLLAAEIKGLDAAIGEAKSHEATACTTSARQQRAQMFKTTLAHCQKFEALVRDAEVALQRAGDLRAQLFELAEEARTSFRTAMAGAGRMPDFIPLIHDGLTNCWNGMVQHHGVVGFDTFATRNEEARGAALALIGEANRLCTLVVVKGSDVLGPDRAKSDKAA